MTRTQIAVQAGLDRQTVTRYLGMEGAPKPDDKQRWSYKEVLPWIQSQAPRLGGKSDEMIKIREARARLDLEEAEHDMKVKRGQYIDKSRIAGVFAVAFGSLTIKLQEVFERELPARLEGRTLIERTELMAAGIDRVLGALKEDMDRLSKVA